MTYSKKLLDHYENPRNVGSMDKDDMNLVNLTESAKSHLKKLTQDNNKKYVRLEVKGGGCAGFRYDWSFDNYIQDSDDFIKFDGFTLLIDKSSLLYLMGMTIEYKKEIFGSFLELKNPNATSSCGCGESFGV